MAELVEKAQFPPGVFNLVQGDGAAGGRLVANEHVDGILFTGSYEVGLKIKQETLTHYWKILALKWVARMPPWCGMTLIWTRPSTKV